MTSTFFCFSSEQNNDEDFADYESVSESRGKKTINWLTNWMKALRKRTWSYQWMRLLTDSSTSMFKSTVRMNNWLANFFYLHPPFTSEFLWFNMRKKCPQGVLFQATNEQFARIFDFLEERLFTAEMKSELYKIYFDRSMDWNYFGLENHDTITGLIRRNSIENWAFTTHSLPGSFVNSWQFYTVMTYITTQLILMTWSGASRQIQ